MVQENNLLPIQIEVDCQDIINYLHNDHLTHTNFLRDCRVPLHQLGNPLIQHKFWEVNQVADALAKKGSNLPATNSFVN
ncbi:hypothetical protein MTR67_012983 [Solanum verrucosum]|uniref:RNase H type-1 domain-containing protein n=1 Tax=Solanum verrucosum TaxID=315347 RepID=A0AAF0TLF9_SOLVR|nr:hypothetical protein MTR67_012983 [Solanum verrucosum]